MRTLSTIVTELGHHGRIIDAVKIDIEGPRIGYEDKAIRSIIETVSIVSFRFYRIFAQGIYKCIRQISLELHVFGPIHNPEYVRLQYSVMKGLEEKGFKLFDVQESFGRSMEDIRSKVVTVSVLALRAYHLCLIFIGKNSAAMVLRLGKHKS